MAAAHISSGVMALGLSHLGMKSLGSSARPLERWELATVEAMMAA
ncbi:hypothetical protein ACIG63_27265 [Streptomyces antimycoticus]